MNAVIHHLPFIVGLVASLALVTLLQDTFTALMMSTILIISSYITATLVKIRREGVATDERQEYISLKTRATAFDATLITAGLMALARAYFTSTGYEAPRVLTEMSILVLLAITYYAIAYIIYYKTHT